MTEAFAKNMRAALEILDLRLNDKQLLQLFTYYEMLVEKNKVMNLTAITDERGVITKHFVDSLSIAGIDEIKSKMTGDKAVKLIDVGTGAGFPGLVLKIAFPVLNVTLLDSLNKRLNFLNEVIETLELEDVTTVHGRAEDLGRDKKYREGFDMVTSRAVANLATLSEYCLPLLKPGGAFIAYKSVSADEELSDAADAIGILGGGVTETKTFMLPESDIQRCLVVINKLKPTPKAYPRKAGTPLEKPLGKNGHPKKR